ncbi:MAG TPA: EF-Tu/IF-2/RF-3 family GTPase, partial [Candidatus Berkiella sp.]|nr:EF-Tu/IF-2/RF-3 family GTPase [Candidatus Berkiella sp.]
TPLFEEIVKRVEPPVCDPEGPFQMQISSLDYSSYVGTIGIGLIKRGTIKSNTQVSIIDSQGRTRPGKVLQILGYLGLERIEQPEGKAGEIVAITGIEPLAISDTICDKGNVEALPALKVDEPTISMTFQVNTSPFAGLDGKFVTSRQIRER